MAADPLVTLDTLAARLRGRSESLRDTVKRMRRDAGPWRGRGVGAPMAIAANVIDEIALEIEQTVRIERERADG
jgi:hypothetical protein